jgi:hypothetical protein
VVENLWRPSEELDVDSGFIGAIRGCTSYRGFFNSTPFSAARGGCGIAGVFRNLHISGDGDELSFTEIEEKK